MWILPCFDRSESNYPLTECYIPDEPYPLLYSGEILKFPSLEFAKNDLKSLTDRAAVSFSRLALPSGVI